MNLPYYAPLTTFCFPSATGTTAASRLWCDR